MSWKNQWKSEYSSGGQSPRVETSFDGGLHPSGHVNNPRPNRAMWHPLCLCRSAPYVSSIRTTPSHSYGDGPTSTLYTTPHAITASCISASIMFLSISSATSSFQSHPSFKSSFSINASMSSSTSQFAHGKLPILLLTASIIHSDPKFDLRLLHFCIIHGFRISPKISLTKSNSNLWLQRRPSWLLISWTLLTEGIVEMDVGLGCSRWWKMEENHLWLLKDTVEVHSSTAVRLGMPLTYSSSGGPQAPVVEAPLDLSSWSSSLSRVASMHFASSLYLWREQLDNCELRFEAWASDTCCCFFFWQTRKNLMVKTEK